jgi:hypothetical protein
VLGMNLVVAGEACHMKQVVRVSSSASGRPYTNSSISPFFVTMRSRGQYYGPDAAPFV